MGGLNVFEKINYKKLSNEIAKGFAVICYQLYAISAILNSLIVGTVGIVLFSASLVIGNPAIANLGIVLTMLSALGICFVIYSKCSVNFK